VVFDEVKYEGTENYRWGQLTPEEMTHRMWSGLVAGTYVQHGECYLHTNDTWLSYGGVLRGESWKRIAFLRNILEDAPPGGLNPLDKWQDWDMGGKPGEYYLKYFGQATPASWAFELPRDGVEEGMQFRVDVIDTWNMTIVPVDGVFTLKRKDRYSFVDGSGRPVKLPGKPGVVVRVRHAGGGGAKPAGVAPVEPF
jgi:hypothetical protein